MVGEAECVLCVAVSGVEAASAGHAAGDSGSSGGVLGSGAYSAQQADGGERLSGLCRAHGYPVPR